MCAFEKNIFFIYLYVPSVHWRKRKIDECNNSGEYDDQPWDSFYLIIVLSISVISSSFKVGLNSLRNDNILCFFQKGKEITNLIKKTIFIAKDIEY